MGDVVDLDLFVPATADLLEGWIGPLFDTWTGEVVPVVDGLVLDGGYGDQEWVSAAEARNLDGLPRFYLDPLRGEAHDRITRVLEARVGMYTSRRLAVETLIAVWRAVSHG